MKAQWDKIMQKAAFKRAAKHLSSEGIELISNDFAQSLRGGDKDYSPVYEHEVEKQSQFTNPSMLLKL